MFYIFKDKDNKRQLFNEQQAHMELRNKGKWQRQDLVYLGEIQLTAEEIVTNNKNIREAAVFALVRESEAYKNLEAQVSLAKLKKEPTEIMEAEKNLLESDVRMSLGRLDNMTGKDERNHMAFHKIIDKLMDEWMETLTPDNKKLPRNLNDINTKLSGNEMQ